MDYTSTYALRSLNIPDNSALTNFLDDLHQAEQHFNSTFCLGERPVIELLCGHMPDSYCVHTLIRSDDLLNYLSSNLGYEVMDSDSPDHRIYLPNKHLDSSIQSLILTFCNSRTVKYNCPFSLDLLTIKTDLKCHGHYQAWFDFDNKILRYIRSYSPGTWDVAIAIWYIICFDFKPTPETLSKLKCVLNYSGCLYDLGHDIHNLKYSCPSKMDQIISFLRSLNAAEVNDCLDTEHISTWQDFNNYLNRRTNQLIQEAEENRRTLE